MFIIIIPISKSIVLLMRVVRFLLPIVLFCLCFGLLCDSALCALILCWGFFLFRWTRLHVPISGVLPVWFPWVRLRCGPVERERADAHCACEGAVSVLDRLGLSLRMRELRFSAITADRSLALPGSSLPLPSALLNARRGAKTYQGFALGDLGWLPPLD